jgi:recombination protein RecT
MSEENNDELNISTKEEKIIRQEPFYKLINDRREKLLPILDDDGALLEKMARSFVFTIYKDNLTQCNHQSIIEAFIKCCELKLDPVSGLGKLYLINYNGNLNVQVGYQGWLELLWRAPLVANVYSNVVYEEDEFEVEYGITTSFRHKPKFQSERLKMTYAFVKFNNGESQIKTASIKEIMESKAASKGSHSSHSPWNKYFDAMAQIVPLRKLAKNLSLAIRNDDEFINQDDILREKSIRLVSAPITSIAQSESVIE